MESFLFSLPSFAHMLQRQRERLYTCSYSNERRSSHPAFVAAEEKKPVHLRIGFFICWASGTHFGKLNNCLTRFELLCYAFVHMYLYEGRDYERYGA
jgi:hypothetical protein